MADGSFRIGDGFVEITARDLTAEGRRRAQRAVESLRNGTVRIDADTRRVETQIRQVRQHLTELGSRTPSVQVDIDTAAARAQLAQLQARLGSLRTARVDVDVDTDLANRRLALIAANAARARASLNGFARDAVATGNSSRSGAAGVSRLTAILAAVPGIAGAAGAALAGLPAIMAALGSSVGVLAGAFSGVGAALQGYEADQKSAAAASGGGAAAAASNARAIRDATESINDAKRDQARVARDTAYAIADAEASVADAMRGVEDAQRSLSDAQRDASRAAISAAKAVERAESDLADTQIQAARDAQSAADAVAAASRRLQSAQTSERHAQEDLNDARAEALQQLDDLAEKSSDVALDQEGAAIALLEAQKDLAKTNDDVTATDLDKRKALYAVAVAQERVSDLEKEATDTAEKQADALKKGVEGADNVVAAKERLAEANLNTRDAEQELGKAQVAVMQQAVDSAKRIAEAQGQVSDARDAQAQSAEDSARRIADAQRGVEDAQRSAAEAEEALRRARESAAEAQEDAARRVADAMQGLADAQADAAESAGGGASAASAYADAMAKLSPAAQMFVKQLIAMKPLVKSLQDTAASAFLPGLTQMLKDSAGLFPIFERSMGRTGQIMGDTAAKMGELFKTDQFKANLQTLLDSSLPIVQAIGDALVRFTQDFVEFGAQMAPIGDSIAHFINGFSSGLSGMFAEMAPYQATFSATWEALGQIFESLLPILGKLISGFTAAFLPVLQTIGDVLSTNEETIKAWIPLVTQLATAFLLLNPVGKMITTLGASVAGMAGRMGAAETTTSRISGVFSKLGGALPILGVAFIGVSAAMDAMDDNSKSLMSALMQGGDAARNTAVLMDGYNAALKSGNPLMGLFVESSEDVRKEYDAQVAAMSPLEQAQLRQKQAQQEYNDALKRFTAGSPEIATALESLRDATGKVEVAQDDAEQATKSHTQAMADQVAQIQTALGADVNYQQSLDRLRDAQKEAGEAAHEHGANTDEAASANLRVVDAANSAAEAASRKAEAEAKANGVSDTSKIKADAYTTSLLSMAAGMDGPAQAALLKYTGHLDDATLAAITAASETSGFATKVITLPNGKTVTVVVDPEQALTTLAQVEAATAAKTAILTLDAQVNPATQKIQGVIDLGDGSVSRITLDALPDPATGKINGVVDLGNGQTARITVDAKPDPATGKINATVTYGDGRTTVVKLDADDARGMAKLNDFKVLGDRTVATPRVEANTSGAQNSFWSWFNALPSIFNVVVRTLTGQAAGGILGNATGNLVVPQAMGFAKGGAAKGPGMKLRPMSGSRATVVPPNTWRVIGDNMKVPELYAPLDGSSRSLGLISQAAASYGLQLTQLATGGGGGGGSSSIRSAIPAAATPDAGAATGTGGGGTTINLGGVTLQVQGMLDFRERSTASRRMVEDLRAYLREIERSYSSG